MSVDDALGEFAMLLQETAQYQQRDAAAVAMLQRAQKTLGGYHRRLASTRRRYVLAVVGLTNVGKSTLMSALFGAEFCPRGNYPCTAVPVEYRYDNTLSLTEHRTGILRRKRLSFNQPKELLKRLQQLVDDRRAAGDGDRSKLEKVAVTFPCPLLQSGLVLSDTPGFGAAQLGDLEGGHEAALRTYLQTDVAQVLWVVRADVMIGIREITYHDQYFCQICDDVIVTNAEEFHGVHDQTRWVNHVESRFPERLPRFHFVSGKEGLDPQQIEQSGIVNLERRIRDLATPEGRKADIAGYAIDLADHLGVWLAEHLSAIDGPHSGSFWRPDAWARLSAMAQSDSTASRLRDKLSFKA